MAAPAGLEAIKTLLIALLSRSQVGTLAEMREAGVRGLLIYCADLLVQPFGRYDRLFVEADCRGRQC